jgi:iron complex outermembrane recepter protein
MTLTYPILRGLRPLVACAFVFLAAMLSAQTVSDTPQNFDIPPGDARPMLKQFASQANKEILFDVENVSGIKTRAVRGTMTPQQALDQMLADTGLVAGKDVKTGAFAIRRETEDESKNGAGRLAQGEAARNSDGTIRLQDFDVNERRIDGLNNKGLLQGGPDAALYHDVVTRQDIERLGITSIEELFRLIPQTSSANTSIQGAVTNTVTSGGIPITTSSMGLRGFAAGQTVILINGRQLPRTNLNAGNGPDLQRIPLASIERVEILPYSGSAIYGAGAIGGAVNIILRKEYTGKDLTAYFGTTTDGGATEYRVTYVDGRRFNNGRTSITSTFNYQHRDPLYAKDRDYLDRALSKFGPSSNVRTSSGRTVFEQYILPAFAGAPGTVVVDSSASVTASLGIPGAPGARYATIPTGTTATTVLTPGSFTATAGLANLSSRFGRSVLYEPLDSYSFNAQVEHEFAKDRLSAYGEFTVGNTRKSYSFPQFLAVSLAAGNPLNPFPIGVTVYLDTPDVPDASVLAEYESARGVVGFKGKFTDRWEWSVDGVVDYTHNTNRSYNPFTNIIGLNQATPAATLAERRLVYPIFADHRTNPMSAADVERYLYSVQAAGSHGVLSEGNVRVIGDVWDLPAGPLRVSAFGKYQKWEFSSGGSFDVASEYLRLRVQNPSAASSSENRRDIQQGAAEFDIPVIGKNWRPIPIESLSLQASVSQEINDTYGTLSGVQSKTRARATTGVVAAKLQLVRDLALRASYSEGFFPPTFGQVANPTTIQTVPVGIVPDARRGNTIQATPWNIFIGGNPNLKPEQSESLNYGVILTPRSLPDLNLSVDYWKIEKTDAITTVQLPAVFANPDLYAFSMQRATPTPAEAALNWLGPVTSVDQRPLNAAKITTEGIDTRLRYTMNTDAAGSFIFNANASFTNNFVQYITPTAAPQNLAGGSGPVKWRGVGSVTWMKDRVSITGTGRYVGHYHTSFTNPSESFPNAVPIDGGRIPAYLHWDLQFTYDFPGSFGQKGWRDWIGGTRWTLGVLNVLNEEPAYSTGTGAISGASFYNQYDDPRQRFIYLSIRKSL